MEGKIGFFKKLNNYMHRLSGVQFIALGYLAVIFIGSFLLSLPIASKQGVWTPYINSLFTATSATCVTGLVVYDTFTYWSTFGQLVILFLIQIGGIGFMTIITLVSMFFRRHIGLYERKVLMQSANTLRLDGIVSLIKRVLLGTLIFETFGALLLSIRFIDIFGVGRGIYFAIFHSISAFCNAGFDLMGINQTFSSFTTLQNDPLINFTLMALIFIGGLGFVVWSDVWDCKFSYKKFNLHTKIVLVATAILIIVPTLLFMIFEYNNTFAGKNFGQILLNSLFQSITPRTAGFNTIDQASLSESSKMLTTLLMFIGGNSGSTAGGIKVTTIVVLFLSGIASARNKSEIEIFKKRIDKKIVHTASSIALAYVCFIFIGALIICAVQPNLSLTDVIFETVSAIGTVGLSLGITADLTIASKCVIMLLMYVGRLGALTFALAFIEKNEAPIIKRPIGKIMIG